MELVGPPVESQNDNQIEHSAASRSTDRPEHASAEEVAAATAAAVKSNTNTGVVDGALLRRLAPVDCDMPIRSASVRPSAL
jgi:hypothetical protein